MKLISMLLAVFLATGCTTMQPVEMSPEQLQERISAGGILNAGDPVSVTTVNGENHRFDVVAVTEGNVVGKDINVPIEDIVRVETESFDSDATTEAVAIPAILLVLLGIAVSSISVW